MTITDEHWLEDRKAEGEARADLNTLWNTVRVETEDISDQANRVQERAEALARFASSVYAESVECLPEGDNERRDIEMLGRMLDHLDIWLRFLNSSRDDLRTHLAGLAELGQGASAPTP